MATGFIGTGSIGAPLAGNLLAQEKDLMVFDIDPGATRGLAERQARVAASPSEVTRNCDTVFACLPSIESFHATTQAMANGAVELFVNLGTMGTAAVTQAEETLQQHNVQLLDCPVTGGVARARKADIAVIASGPRPAFERAEPLLAAMSREIHYVGEEVGQAQLVKVCNNIMSFTNLVVAAEALVMAAKGGVDPEKALAVINAGSGQNSASLSKIPNAVLNRKFDLEAPMPIIEKDAVLWRMEAERLEVPQNVAAATYHTIRQALAMGLGSGDLSDIVRVVERAADFELPKTRD
jgi:3-hydroxyisobutyrate dehydrogenase-like beta-hydroxyacid dehydrogenase